jgi:membrane protein YdbS with pleckstrin-like domain
VVLVVLAVVWAIVLVPTLLHRRRHGDSISHFHHQLGILQRGDTPADPPPYRLQSVPSRRSITVNGAPLSTPPVLTVVGCDQLPKPALAYLGEKGPSPLQTPVESNHRPADPVAQDPDRANDAYGRQLARTRRRDTLMVLVLTFACSLLLGMIPAAHLLWVVSAVSAVAIVAYVAVLVHLRGVAEERERKLHYLRPDPQYGAGVAAGVYQDDDRYRDAQYDHPAGRSVAAH